MTDFCDIIVYEYAQLVMHYQITACVFKLGIGNGIHEYIFINVSHIFYHIPTNGIFTCSIIYSLFVSLFD